MVKPIDPLVPSSANRAVYDDGFRRYSALYNAISDFTWGDN
jgi:hypothetical protein